MSDRAVRMAATTAVGAALTAALVACGSGASSTAAVGSTSSGAVAPSPDTSHPAGVVAIGHSALTGLSSDPGRPQQNAPENSWATGTNPQVDSVYLRLVRALPETQGKVANTAVNGAKAETLADQAREALQQVPAPRLVLVQTLDNDIRCDGTDEANHAAFRESVREAVTVIAQASPMTQVLVVSNFGRPAGYAAAVRADPVASRDNAGTGMCDLFSGPGKVNSKGVATLTRIIEGYEAEQERACAGIRTCHTDKGALHRYRESLDDLAPDRNHLLASGHAALARTIWPTVVEVLDLPS